MLDPRCRRERFQRTPLGQPIHLATKVNGDKSMLVTREGGEDVELSVLQDPRDMVRAELPEPQVPVMQCHVFRDNVERGTIDIGRSRLGRLNLWVDGRYPTRILKEPNAAPTSRSDVEHRGKAGLPTARERQGSGAIIVVRERESAPTSGYPHGEGWQVTRRRRWRRCARCVSPKHQSDVPVQQELVTGKP